MVVGALVHAGRVRRRARGLFCTTRSRGQNKRSSRAKYSARSLVLSFRRGSVPVITDI